MKNLVTILNILLALKDLGPEIQALIDRVMEMIRQTAPTESNAELVAALEAHGLANATLVDAWLTAHPV